MCLDPVGFASAPARTNTAGSFRLSGKRGEITETFERRQPRPHVRPCGAASKKPHRADDRRADAKDEDPRHHGSGPTGRRLEKSGADRRADRLIWQNGRIVPSAPVRAGVVRAKVNDRVR
jgi:hypothetical protein